MEYSTKIYEIYLKYIAPEDIHVYSIDEVFTDVTAYLNTYSLTARELAAKIIQYVLTQTKRIGQLVITPVVIADFVTEPGRQRGTRAFGSTGK